MRATLFSALAVLLAQPTFAQSRIEGDVHDESGGALAACRVVLLSAQRKPLLETQTNAIGRYVVQPVAAGKYYLQMTAPGFEPAVSEVTLSKEPVTRIGFVLRIARAEFQLTVGAMPAEISIQADENASALTLTSDNLDMLPSLDQDFLATAGEFLGSTGAPSFVVDGIERDSLDLPPSAIAEIKINRNPYSAEYSRPGSSRMEITTRGAARELRGAASLFLRNSALDARNAFAARRLRFSRQSVDLSLSGPLSARRKIDFFLAFQGQDGARVRPIRAVLPTGLLQADSLSDSNETKFHARLDGQLSAAQTLSFRWNSDRESSANEGIGGLNLLERARDANGWDDEASLSWTTIWSQRAVNHLQVELDWETQNVTSRTQSPSLIVHGAFSGGGAQEQSLQRQLRLQIQEVVSYSSGVHSVRAGGGTRSSWLSNEDRSNFGGSFEFGSLADFEAGQPIYYRRVEGDPFIRFAQHGAFGFGQEDWRLRPDLNLSAGLRVETQPSFRQTLNLAPRLGLAWSPGGRKTVLRGGFGVFYERFPYSLLERTLRFDGLRVRSLIVTDPGYPDPQATAAPTVLPSSIYLLAADLQTPSIWVSGFSLERQLPGSLILASDYRLQRGIHLLRSRNLNAPQPGNGLRPLPLAGNTNQYESSASSREQTFTVNLRSRWKLGDLSAQYRYLRAYGDTEGAGFLPVDNFNLHPEWGRLAEDRRHRLQLASTARLPRGFRLGLISSLSSGGPFDITTGADDNGDTEVNDRPAGTRRNSGHGPGFAKLDVRLGKEWVLPKVDGRKLQLETVAEAFNVFNRVNLGNFVGNLSSPFFSQATSALDARRLQLSVRFRF
ncbi:MAG: carboxypeptidase regulatory-like domain-containing protein [Acidobacteria bacterium]|nr:carboxypeptidase regulatory-like domain-containing protein [Acidobacteriota bacterium]MCI0718582.1 carboxypeptidase regulatory-like domain-containing protein [Acidobacteriota bacterium]